MDWEEFKEKVYWILFRYGRQYNIHYYDDKIIFSIGNKEFVFNYSDYYKFKANVGNYKYNKFTLNTGKRYEAVIYDLTGYNFGFYGIFVQSMINKLDDKISLEVGDISNEMLYYIIKELDLDYDIGDFPLKEIIYDNLNEVDIWKLLSCAMYNLKSIVVRSDDCFSEQYFTNLVNAYLFEYSLNCNDLFRVPQRISDIFNEEEIFDSGFRYYENVSFPKKAYKQELIDQYNKARTSNDPMLQFIGYYHVLEYFFNQIVIDDAYDYLKEQLCTSKTYNLNEKDLQTICKIINEKYSSLMRKTEINALGLILKKYVTINFLKRRLSRGLVKDYNENEDDILLIDNFINYPINYTYYKEYGVSFSGGNIVDLDGDDEDFIYKNLKERIYKTRNALVHSKASAKYNEEDKFYKPFEDDVELENEIPLIRAIAEQVIINTAEEI